jgi:hypothetical protein
MIAADGQSAPIKPWSKGPLILTRVEVDALAVPFTSWPDLIRPSVALR